MGKGKKTNKAKGKPLLATLRQPQRKTKTKPPIQHLPLTRTNSPHPYAGTKPSIPTKLVHNYNTLEDHYHLLWSGVSPDNPNAAVLLQGEF